MSDAPIAERGEDEIVLAGVTYRLRPSHAALRAIERKTERSTIELYSLGNRGGLTIVQLGQILGALIRAGAAEGSLERHVNDERIEELVFEAGLHSAMARVTLMLIGAASGGRTSSGEAVAPAETSGTAGAD